MKKCNSKNMLGKRVKDLGILLQHAEKKRNYAIVGVFLWWLTPTGWPKISRADPPIPALRSPANFMWFGISHRPFGAFVTRLPAEGGRQFSLFGAATEGTSISP